MIRLVLVAVLSPLAVCAFANDEVVKAPDSFLLDGEEGPTKNGQVKVTIAPGSQPGAGLENGSPAYAGEVTGRGSSSIGNRAGRQVADSVALAGAATQSPPPQGKPAKPISILPFKPLPKPEPKDPAAPGDAAPAPAFPPGYEGLPGQVAEQVAQGDGARAGELIRQALAKHPDDPNLKALQRLVERKVADQDPKALQRKIDSIAALQASEAMPEAQLASVVSFGGAARTAPAPGAFAPAAALPEHLRNGPVADATRKIAMGDYAAAERLLLTRLERDPADALAWRNLAFVRYKTGRFPESLRDAGRSLELNPADRHARNIKWMDYLALDRAADAKAEADRALAADPRDAEALVGRGRAHKALGDDAAARADFAAAAELDARFEALLDQELARGSGSSRSSWAKGRSKAVWVGAVGTALLFFSFVLYRKRGDTSVRLELRREDHEAARAAFAPAPARPDAVPQGFRVTKTLGQGGMGVVFEAVDLALQRTVALKKLRPEVADNPRERQRFLKEARLVAGLRHPSIVEIYSIHENEEGLFLVFERVPGETLHDRLGRGALEPAEAVFYLRQVAAALDYAHGLGVVHQDLKPANVMVHGTKAKVMDFGIARRVQETLSTLSKVEIAGTPAYMAPEQEQGGQIGPTADVYALGVCAYEMLTGRLPFPQGGLMAKANRLYRPATEGTPLHKDVDAVLAKALDPVPPARPASASAFVDALARALA